MSDAGEAGGPEERKVTSPALVWPGIAPGKDAAAPEDARVAERVAERAAERETVAACQRGDREAFDRLVQRYQREVYRLCYRYLGQHEDANDLAQEVFLRAWRSIGRFRGDSAFSTWLYRIAVNTAKNHLVAAKRRPPSSDVEADEAEHYTGAQRLHDFDTPEHEMLRQEIAREVSETVAQLPEELRQAITLRELEGLSYEEIAEMMDCPIGTVRSRIFRAREAIDARLRPLMDRERVRP